MSVYFVTCREANAVKIGHSIEPQARLPEIQWGCPMELRLEAIMPGDASEEARLHHWFADDRIRGEWFTITPLIERLIEIHGVQATGSKRRRSKPREPKPWHRKSEAERYRLLISEQSEKRIA